MIFNFQREKFGGIIFPAYQKPWTSLGGISWGDIGKD